MEIRSTTTDILVILTVSSGSLWRLSTMYPDRYGPKLECIASTLDTLMHKITMVPNPELSPKTTIYRKPCICNGQTQLFHIYIDFIKEKM